MFSLCLLHCAFRLILAWESRGRHSGLFECFGSKWHPWHGEGVLFSLCQVFLFLMGQKRRDWISSPCKASISFLRVRVCTSLPLLTQGNEIVHRAHCLIVYPLLLSEAETLNRGNSFSSGFMPHGKHIIPAICFNFILGWNLNIWHGFSFLHFFFFHGPVSLGRIVLPLGLTSRNFLVCWILEAC